MAITGISKPREVATSMTWRTSATPSSGMARGYHPGPRRPGHERLEGSQRQRLCQRSAAGTMYHGAPRDDRQSRSASGIAAVMASADSSQDPTAHATPAPWRLGSLRSNLIALTVVAVVPVLGLATYLTVAQSRAQREAV